MFGIKTRKEVAKLKKQVDAIEERQAEVRFRERVPPKIRAIAGILVPGPIWCDQVLAEQPAKIRKMGYNLQELVSAGHIVLPELNTKKKS